MPVVLNFAEFPKGIVSATARAGAPPLSDETISRESIYREREDSQLVSYLLDSNVLLRLVQKTGPIGHFGAATAPVMTE